MSDEQSKGSGLHACDHDWVTSYRQGSQDQLPPGSHEECSKCKEYRFVPDDVASGGGGGGGGGFLMTFLIIIILIFTFAFLSAL